MGQQRICAGPRQSWCQENTLHKSNVGNMAPSPTIEHMRDRSSVSLGLTLEPLQLAGVKTLLVGSVETLLGSGNGPQYDHLGYFV